MITLPPPPLPNPSPLLKMPRTVQVSLAEALTGFVRTIVLVDGRKIFYKPEEGEVISPGAVRKLKARRMGPGHPPFLTEPTRSHRTKSHRTDGYPFEI